MNKYIIMYNRFDESNMLSKNHNGIVYKTGSVGFSPKVVMRQLEKIFKEIEVDIVDYTFAKTGTIYLECWSEVHPELDLFDVRLSNHTKRGDIVGYIDPIRFMVIKNNSKTLSEIEILNHSMKEEVFEYFNKFKKNKKKKKL